MHYCTRCVMPDTKPGVILDNKGVCGACRYVEKKKLIDWDERAAQLQRLSDQVRGSNGNGYECIVPVSGGKDSTYQVYMMSKVYNLKTLGIIVAPHLQTSEGISNLNSMVTNLGVDLMKISVRPSTLQKIRKFATLELGNPSYAEHRVVFAGVARAALTTGAPLVVWGEDIATEFGGNVASSSDSDGSAEDLINNDLFRESSFDDLIKGRISENELHFYTYPSESEFQKRNVRSIYLSHYDKWDGFKNYEVAKQFGFQALKSGPLSGNILAYDNIDEKLCEIHIWFKMLKLGFWRPTDQCCYQIWNGRMSREEAVEIVNNKQYEFPYENVAEFLEYHQMSETELFECMEHWRNHELWHQVNGKWRLKYELQ
jgi:N-acetyl sugar amidotransferase